MGISNVVTNIRQNHALEHATMHILTRSVPSLRLMGRSDWGGFTLYGEVDTQQVLCAVTEGLARLKEGQSWLAVHPRCGTNLATTALLIELQRCASRSGAHPAAPGQGDSDCSHDDRRATAPAPGVSRAVQRSITTAPDLENAHVRLVRREGHGTLTTHRVLVTHDGQANGYVLHLSR